MNYCTLSRLQAAGLAAGLCFSATTQFAAEYEANLDQTFQVSPGGKLVIQVDQGSCELKPTAGDQVVIHVSRVIKGGTKAQADEIFADHEVTLKQDANTVTILAKKKKSLSVTPRNRPNLEVRYEVTLPRKFDVDVRTAGGDIGLGDLDGKVKAATSSGSIHLKQITGAVEAADAGGDIAVAECGGDLAANTSSGAIRVQQVRGKATLSNSGGDIAVADAENALVARTSSGSIRVKLVKGDLTANDAGGDIFAETVGGDMTASTSSGAIKVGQVKGKRAEFKNAGGNIEVGEMDGSLAAQTSSGAINIRTAKGAVSAINSGGDIGIGQAGDAVKAETSSGAIKLGTAKGSVDLRNSGGDIHIGEVDGPTVVRTSSGSIKLKLAKGKVEARNSGGDITMGEVRAPVHASTSSGAIEVVFGSAPTDDCRLEVSGGGITLTLPKSSALDLDARSSGGTVASELSIVSGQSGPRKPESLVGKVNGGGPTLYLRSSSGDIRLKASNAPASTAEAEEPAK